MADSSSDNSGCLVLTIAIFGFCFVMPTCKAINQHGERLDDLERRVKKMDERQDRMVEETAKKMTYGWTPIPPRPNVDNREKK